MPEDAEYFDWRKITHCSECGKKLGNPVRTIKGLDAVFCSNECQDIVVAKRQKMWSKNLAEEAPIAETPNRGVSIESRRGRKKASPPESSSKPASLINKSKVITPIVLKPTTAKLAPSKQSLDKQEHTVAGTDTGGIHTAEVLLLGFFRKNPKQEVTMGDLLHSILKGKEKAANIRQATWNLIAGRKLQYISHKISLKG